ncbi:MAG: hypothetical protein D6709_01195 [Chloroflexi bacterium]|uniref:Acetoacetate decarboxylase n=1 Tax=Candidatus Thermofonsia Clade 3 bacterium TaxID=2364212 RepID=A0A2M8QC73_9CHLR|nr:acetoacetate decarboxylase family protein [Candidatus Roseilinea sp. NK_OTU-006]PJF47380.1 MAG: hypothetical protein CUN48_09040 [Candidatus Thermofonsia Clade 3 bacterium]RMG65949.1 MAG: hypothetical protein D6709_01195 [Chloroflexota bacterium]
MSTPPPWHLTGDGFIWLFRFSRAFVERDGFMADWQRAHLQDTLGAVMLVNYHETSAGPYHELLFIPGRLQLMGRRLFSISKIYVSTEASMRGGIENWGIPKECAAFAREQHANSSVSYRVMYPGRVLFSATLAPFGPRFPISSALVPLAVAQARKSDLLITRPTARGTARLCRVRELKVEPAFFPDITACRPLVVIAVERFRMTFPPPEVAQGYFIRTAHDVAAAPGTG